MVVAGACRAPSPPPNVLLVTIDTLRADHVGAYGYARATTPILDRFAEDATLFENAITPCPATAPALASLLTGLHPPLHGVGRNGDRLAAGADTLAELLAARGYATAAVIANPVIDRHGFDQGFASFELPATLARFTPGMFGGEPVAQAGVGLVASLAEPFFVWLHFMDPHGPYFPPPRFRALFDPAAYRDGDDASLAVAKTNYGLDLIPSYQQVGGSGVPSEYRARYDAEIRYVDALVGRVLAALQRSGRGPRTVVVVTADHGEALGGHHYWFQHGWFLYDDSVRVPLLVRAPGKLPPGQRVGATVSLVDLTPTILELAGVPRSAALEGHSLLRTAAGGVERPAFAETPYGNRLSAIRLGSLTYILTPPPPPRERDRRYRDGWFSYWPRRARQELYDRASDPDEAQDLSTTKTATARELRGRLRRWLAARPPRPSSSTQPPLDPEAQRRLRALGYAD